MEETSIVAQPREATGKCPSRRLRKDGKVPAVLYGAKSEGSVNLSISGKVLEKVLHTSAGGNVLVSLTVEGQKKPRMVMFKEVVRHPMRDSIQHVDLYEVAMDHKVTVDIPVHITGKSEGVALGGVMQQEARTINVECLPGNIPESFDVDVTALGIGDAIHIRDLELAKGVEVLDDPDATIVSIVMPTAEVEAKTAEEVEEELSKSFEEKEEGEPEE